MAAPDIAGPAARAFDEPARVPVASQVSGYYLNLDRSPDRRASMERQIAALGLGDVYRRFPAIDGSTIAPNGKLRGGGIAIFRSHHDVLAAARAEGKYVHVLEDDSLLSPVMLPAIGNLIAGRAFERYDIVFTDVSGLTDSGALRQMKRMFEETLAKRGKPDFLNSFRLIDLARPNFGSTSSYVVAPSGLGRLLDLFAHEIASGPRVPVDIFIRDTVRAGRLRAATIFPFVTSFDIDLAANKLSGQPMTDSLAVSSILRHSFFIDSDIEALAAPLAEIMARNAPGEGDGHHRLIVDALSFLLSKSNTRL